LVDGRFKRRVMDERAKIERSIQYYHRMVRKNQAAEYDYRALKEMYQRMLQEMEQVLAEMEEE